MARSFMIFFIIFALISLFGCGFRSNNAGDELVLIAELPEICGNDYCAKTETVSSCPADCGDEKIESAPGGEECGDGQCSPLERAEHSCMSDCESETAPEPSDTISGEECGDGVCSPTEQISQSCNADC